MATPDPSSPERRFRPALPWQAWVAATVLALTAAGLVLVVSAGGDDAVAERASENLDLTPVDEVPSDPMRVEFTDVDGTTGTLAERIDGTPTVVNFFAEWCTPCVKEMPDFEAVYQQVGDEVDFFGLAVDDRPEDTARIIDRTGVTYDWSRDIRGDIANAAEVTQMPATMFIAADGTIEEMHVGALDRAELLGLIEEHLGVTP